MRRRVGHGGITRHPADAWLAPQLRAATPLGIKPRFLIHDNASTLGAHFARVAARTHSEIVRTPVRAPRAPAIAARFLGRVRRECRDHLLILCERHRYRVLSEYGRSFNAARPHHGIGQVLPAPAVRGRRPDPSLATVRALPVLGSLHHDYEWIA